jgi:EAL domain-containing protein (putative c-di-GMP-specific phosphodiesterase class I)/GGDEF domain-containing protein
VSADVTRFVGFAFAAADLLVELDSERRISFALGATTGLSAAGERELAGRPWLSLIAADDHGFVSAMVDALQPGNRCGPVLVKLALAEKDGRPREALLSACRLPMRPDSIACTLGKVSLAAAPHAAAKRRDGESQLLDKNAFADVAANMVEAARNLGTPLGLTLIDVGGLGELRQRLPEQESKQLISRIGGLLRAASVDGNSAGRVGGGRFGVIHAANTDTAALEQQVAGLTKQVDPTGEGAAIQRAVIDLADADLPPDGAMRAIRYTIERFAKMKADEPMPESLAGAFEEMVTHTLNRVRDFTKIVRDSLFSLSYQPIVVLGTGRFHHFEVLARFSGTESPGEMIAFAEEIGIIERFDLAVAARAIQVLRQPAMDKRVSFAVNVSGKSIENGVFAQCLIGLLDDNKPVASRLAFEITESAQLKDLPTVNRTIQEIRSRGFQVGLDDFGAGSASFQYLQALAVDFVKIDGAYIKRLGQSAKDDAMVKGLVRLCDDLGVGTIAEMVETKDQVERLRAMGVRYAQGWHFGKPAPEPVIPWQFDPKAQHPAVAPIKARRA